MAVLTIFRPMRPKPLIPTLIGILPPVESDRATLATQRHLAT